MNDALAVTAVTRFGLGARPGEIAAAAKAPREWLLAQLGPLRFEASAPSLARARELFAQMQRERPVASRAGAAGAKKEISRIYTATLQDMLRFAVTTERPFAARVLDFFSNHFSLSARGVRLRVLVPALEQEAIAPYLGGRFADMLRAVEQHPAMLVYLDNDSSFGPGSRLGRRRNSGLNENLAREILELHTLGVDGGYTQADVRELAMGITGWSIGQARKGEDTGFVFRADGHEPGARQLLGERHAAGGQTQGEAMLLQLARHPATARRMAFKIARHFVADTPAPALVDALAQRWQRSDGDLRAVFGALLDHPESWQPAPRKLKTPREFVVSALRAAAFDDARGGGMLKALEAMGQSPFAAGSPAGYGDTLAAWDGADALLARVDWAGQISARLRSEPMALARGALGSALRPRTVEAMQRAESRRQAIALLLMSPEFQRR